MNIIDKVKSLNLPDGQYVVFGSGPLAVRGIRESSDVDLLVTEDLYQVLKKQGWEEKEWEWGGFYLYKDGVEADDSYTSQGYTADIPLMIANADIIESIPFATLAEILRWKQAYGRPKDLADITLVQNYLAFHGD